MSEKIEAGRAAALSSFLKDFNSEFPDSPMRAMSDPSVASVEVISTGAISLDVALGTGGVPRGRITEIYGPTGGGKTTLALAAAVQAQTAADADEQRSGLIAFIDCEQALNMSLVEAMGIDQDRFMLTQPDYGEQAAEQVERALKSGLFDMIVVDSVAAMTPKSIIDRDYEGSAQMGRHAALMSTFMGRIQSLVNKTQTAVVLLNQVRVALNDYGAPEKSTGGKAIEFYSSVRVEVRTSAGRRIKVGSEVVGTMVQATVKKNKFAAPFKVAEYDVMFGKGISSGGALLGVCEQLGLISRAGASYTDQMTGERIGVGKDKVKEILENDAEMTERFTKQVYATLAENQAETDDGGDDPVLDAFEA